MIEFDRVSRRFGDLDAIRNLNLTLARGEMAFLTGHSGGQEHAVASALVARPTDRRRDTRQWGTHRFYSARSATCYRRLVVFQEHRLLFDRSVHDNVALPLVMAGFSPRDSARRASSLGQGWPAGQCGRIRRCCPAVNSSGWGLRERLWHGPSF